jgi:signal transduction histidine kinase
LFVGSGVTLIALLLGDRFAFRNAELHLELETAAGLIGLLVAYLAFGRFRQSDALGDLLVVAALALFAIANVALAALPGAFAGEETGGFSTWAPLIVRLVGAATFAAAAFAPLGPMKRPRRAAALAALGTGAVIATAAGVVAAFAGRLPLGANPSLAPHASWRSAVADYPVIFGAQIVSAALFAGAALGFFRRATRTRDRLAELFAAGAVLAAIAALHYSLFPSLYSAWIYTGDVLRTGFYVLLLAGAASEIGSYWRARTEAAVLAERSRIERDLHDGLAQELAFIVGETRRIATPYDRSLERLAAAAERALDESRHAISVLADNDQPLGTAITQTVEDMADRFGVTATLELDDRLVVTPATRVELVRIVHEAVTNAARHGRARRITVTVADGQSPSLRIVDDGTGFDPGSVERGFGLESMSGRARSVGAEFKLASAPGRGTRIEIVLPREGAPRP